MDDTSGRIDIDGARRRSAADIDMANGTASARATESGRGSAAAEAGGEVAEHTKRIREEIENTRGEMTETLEAIQEKLKPANIVANATERVKSATTERVREMADTTSQTAHEAMDFTRETANKVVDAARQNPIPLALLGVGAAWWLNSRSRNSSSSSGHNPNEREHDRGYGPAYGRYSNHQDRALNGQEDETGLIARLRRNPLPAALAGVGLSWLAFSSKERSVKRARRSRSEDYDYGWGSRSYEEPSTERPAVTEAGEGATARAREYASDAAGSVRRIARQRKNQLQRTLEQNPLLVGASALILGAAFGLVVPETETENAWMGEARDNVIDRARDIARDAANKVQEAAGSVAEGAMMRTEVPQP